MLCFTKSLSPVMLMLVNFYIETYNALMKVAVASSEEETSATELALGVIRDMKAAGLGELESYPKNMVCT